MEIFILVFFLIGNPAEVLSSFSPINESFSRETAIQYFTQNVGQLQDDKGNPANQVKYYVKLPGYNLFFTHDAVIYEFYESHPSGHKISGKTPFDIPVKKPGTDTVTQSFKRFRLDMVFMGAQPDVQLQAAGKRTGYNNYYSGGAQLKAYSHVSLFDTICYRNIYEGIDLVFYLLPEGKGIKYDFIVHAGADPSEINYTYKGYEHLSLDQEGGLCIRTPLGLLREEKPFTYQRVNNLQKEITSAFTLRGNVAGFSTGSYDKTTDLIIDPSILVWSTYYGGNGTSEQSLHMSTDNSGNLLISGNTNGTVFPTSTGALQTAYGGGSMDGFILKFSPDGNRLWGTYFGGSRDDNARSCEADASGNIFVTGTTMSLNFPLLNPGGGAYYLTVNTASTIVPTNPTTFIARLNAAGQLYWSTYFGGNVGESGTDVWVDASNNLVVTGCTASSNFPVTAGAFQTIMAGPNVSGAFGDAFVAKFNNNGVQQWTTLLGGSLDEIGYGVCTDPSGEVYLTGYTASSNFPVSAGAYQTAFAGGTSDIIFARFSANGNRIWSSYYGGPGNQRGLDICIKGNYIYAAGISSGTLPGPVGSVFQSANNGAVDGFLLKMEPTPSSGQIVWRTFCGGAGDDGIDALVFNNAGNIVCGGWTNSGNFPVTPNAYQVTPGGGYDGQVTTIDPDGKLICATYFGGSFQTDNVYGVAIAPNDDVFLTGNTGSTPAQGFVITPGAFQPVKGNGVDAFIARISEIPPPPVADFTADPSTGCSPLTVALDNKSISVNTCLSNTTWEWTFPGGNPATSNVEKPPPVVYNAAGNYTITLKVSNATGSNTTTKNIVVSSGLPVTISAPASICSGSSAQLTASGAATYTWSPATGLSATTGAVVTASPTTTTTYTVTGTGTTGCTGTATVTVTVSPAITATVSPDVSICGGESTTLTAGGGASYSWTPASGLSSTSGASVTANPSVTTTYTVTVSSGTCQPATATVTITVVQAPQASVSPDITICRGEQTTLSASGGDSYSWSPPAGLNQTSGASVTASPQVTTTYTVSVQRQGCSPSTATVTVTVLSVISPDAGPDVSVCRGQSAVLQGAGAVSYLWSPAAGLSCTDCPNPVASPQVTTTYTLTSGGGNCAAATDEVIVTVLDPPTAGAGPSQTIQKGESAIIKAAGGITYRWLTDNSTGETLVVSPPDDAVFCVDVTGSNGCKDTACATISVSEPVASTLWIPNSFTPNEDQNNSIFQTPGTNIIEYQAAIFNRWGELIYEWRDIEKGWDGKYRGIPVQDDIYAYRIRALGADGLRYNKTGMLLIIK